MTGAHRVWFQLLAAKHETPVSLDASGILFHVTELRIDRSKALGIEGRYGIGRFDK
jgi:hypothetical protein